MVSADGATIGDRAQLVLVGAIAIGIVLIALTTVLNSAVFTENVAGGGSVEVTGDVAEFDRESVRNVRSIVLRINHGRIYADQVGEQAALESNVRQNVSDYSNLLAESYADTGSVYVNLSYEGAPVVGQRVVQRADANFSGVTGSPTNWRPVDGEFELGWFVANFDVENVSQQPVQVNVTNSTGTSLNVSVHRTATNEVVVNSSIGGNHTDECTYEPRNGRVLLDVVDGQAYRGNGDCRFNSTSFLEPPYSYVEIDGGDRARGKYDIVIDDDSSTPGISNHCNAVGATPDRPCRALAIWKVEFDAYYRTGSVDYEKTHNVSVYGG